MCKKKEIEKYKIDKTAPLKVMRGTQNFNLTTKSMSFHNSELVLAKRQLQP